LPLLGLFIMVQESYSVSRLDFRKRVTVSSRRSQNCYPQIKETSTIIAIG